MACEGMSVPEPTARSDDNMHRRSIQYTHQRSRCNWASLVVMVYIYVCVCILHPGVLEGFGLTGRDGWAVG